MRFSRIVDRDGHGWSARVSLDPNEWPPIDEEGLWMDRPIRQWVMENCWPVSFAYYGEILFGKEDEAMWFKMVWG